ncbi:hypothetical protein MVEN_01393800 [Mycena venus]|uniref:Uncharacterized protein n=1 Tax=Mycena venus TaxID=2733690 RepID=A0A8H7CUJ2_9AGAR|nr:hypothetical protein MVEN_01393800 [Mycena venus]
MSQEYRREQASARRTLARRNAVDYGQPPSAASHHRRDVIHGASQQHHAAHHNPVNSHLPLTYAPTHGASQQHHAAHHNPVNSHLPLTYAPTHGASQQHHAAHHNPVNSHLHLTYAPTMNMPPIFMTLAMQRQLPCLPTLPSNAPSKSRDHPYATLRLEDIGSGNYRPAPPRSECAECKMDEYIQSLRRQFPQAPHVPDAVHPNAKLSPVIVCIDFRYEGSDPTSPHGVLVSDILSFRANMEQPHYMLVRQLSGPIKLKLKIEGVGEVEDILYANCKHRGITRFNLAWVLAFSFKTLAQKTFGLGIDRLELTWLMFYEDTQWSAHARYAAA